MRHGMRPLIVMLLVCRAMTSISTADDTAESAKKSAAQPADANAGSQKPTPLIPGVKTGQEWDGDSLKMQFLWCEPGKFVMGSPANEIGRGSDEDEVEVELTKGFWLAKNELTQANWKSVMSTEPWKGELRVQNGPDFPACWTSWDDANLYCRELTSRERRLGLLPDDWEYVLPTEAQWEYACRAGTSTRYSFGDDDGRLQDYAWAGEKRRLQVMHARAVGQKKPNPWGFFDLHGNIVEWCRDWYSAKLPGGKDPFVAIDSDGSVTARGGEWRRDLEWSRSACRQHLQPSGRDSTVGFRVSLQQRDGKNSSSASPRIKLVIIPFENRDATVSFERTGRAIAALVASDLSQFTALDVLERQSSQELIQEAALATRGLAQDSSADQSKVSADYLLTGSGTLKEDRLSLSIRLSKLGVAAPQAEWTVHGSFKDLFQLEQEICQKVADALKIKKQVRQDRTPGQGTGPVLAVLPLANFSTTTRLDDLQVGLADLLQVNLAAVDGVRVANRDQIDKVLQEQKLTLSGIVDPKDALQVGKLLGAQRLLTGSFLELDKTLSVQVRLINTATGAVVFATRVTGASDNFGDLIDELTRRIVAGIEVAPDESSPEQRATLPGRTLESALHVATAMRFTRQGKLPQAAESYQQAILIEPHNVRYYFDRMQALNKIEKYDDVITTGENAILSRSEFDRFIQKGELLELLARAYERKDRDENLQQLGSDFPDVTPTWKHDLNFKLANVLVRKSKFQQAVQLLENAAEEDVRKKGELESVGLKYLFTFYWYLGNGFSIKPPTQRDSEQVCQKMMALYDRILIAAKDSRTPAAKGWAESLIPRALDVQVIVSRVERRPFLAANEKADYLRRGLETFSWIPNFGFEQYYSLATNYESAQKWSDAVDAYRLFLKVSVNARNGNVTPEFGNNGSYPIDWIDRRIEAQYRLAHLLATQLREEDEARKSYRDFAREYGMANFCGPDAMLDLQRLGMTPEIPTRCALVWGGSTSNLKGWRAVLDAEGFQMHGMRTENLTPAHLAPYSLVVLNHSNDFPYMPSELFALRSYVASGGSILILTSPAWHPAAPILQNNLLEFFEMQAETEPVVEAASTRIVPHPITSGISAVTARYAVGLQTSPEAALIFSEDKPVLAAREYRRGRVVAASFGQWFTPEIMLIPESQTSDQQAICSCLAPDDLLRRRGSIAEPPLLRQVIRWLGEPRNVDADYGAWIREWRTAHQTLFEAQARLVPRKLSIRPWEDIGPAFDRLIALAPDATLKEESLWAAGEALLQQGYYNFAYQSPAPNSFVANYEVDRAYMRPNLLGRNVEGSVMRCDPEYFEKLVLEFSESPLLPYAKYRLCDANRNAAIENGLRIAANRPNDISKLARSYQELDVPKESYAWVMGRIRLAFLYFAIDDYRHAADCFDEAAEHAPTGAEKVVALINASKCRAMLAEFSEARRRMNQVITLPEVHLNSIYSAFVVQNRRMNEAMAGVSAGSRMMATAYLQAMDRMEKKR